jgi:hypothetical protein
MKFDQPRESHFSIANDVVPVSIPLELLTQQSNAICCELTSVNFHDFHDFQVRQ